MSTEYTPSFIKVCRAWLKRVSLDTVSLEDCKRIMIIRIENIKTISPWTIQQTMKELSGTEHTDSWDSKGRLWTEETKNLAPFCVYGFPGPNLPIQSGPEKAMISEEGNSFQWIWSELQRSVIVATAALSWAWVCLDHFGLAIKGACHNHPQSWYQLPQLQGWVLQAGKFPFLTTAPPAER